MHSCTPTYLPPFLESEEHVCASNCRSPFSRESAIRLLPGVAQIPSYVITGRHRLHQFPQRGHLRLLFAWILGFMRNSKVSAWRRAQTSSARKWRNWAKFFVRGSSPAANHSTFWSVPSDSWCIGQASYKLLQKQFFIAHTNKLNVPLQCL